MHAHKFKVNVEPDHPLAIRLPNDFPPGPAEVIVLAESRPAREGASIDEVSTATDIDAEFARLFPRDTLLGRVIFHEDPTAPLSPEDWPEAFDDETAA